MAFTLWISLSAWNMAVLMAWPWEYVYDLAFRIFFIWFQIFSSFPRVSMCNKELTIKFINRSASVFFHSERDVSVQLSTFWWQVLLLHSCAHVQTYASIMPVKQEIKQRVILYLPLRSGRFNFLTCHAHQCGQWILALTMLGELKEVVISTRTARLAGPALALLR